MRLYYVHDPMCSWCWAFRPVLLQLIKSLPSEIEFIRLLGGLAPDSNIPMSENTRTYVIENWQRIQQQVPHTKFNYDFWTDCQPKRSTYLACRAVIAARQQGESFDDAMTHAIQQAYYLQARNPSEQQTLIELSAEIGLDKNQFSNDLLSEQTNTLLNEEISTARSLHLNSFPGFLYIDEKTKQHIQPDYNSANVLLETIKPLIL